MENNRTILYARVAIAEQVSDEQLSINAQIIEMNEYAEKNDLAVVASFVEEGVSGTRNDRSQLLAALESVKSGECDILLVYDLSRLSRSIDHTLDILKILEEKEVCFASVKESDFDFTAI